MISSNSPVSSDSSPSHTDATILTPAGSVSPLPPQSPQQKSQSIPLQTLPRNTNLDNQPIEDSDDELDHGSDGGDMSGRPTSHRPSGGLSYTHEPLLSESKDGRGRRSEHDSVGKRHPHPARNTFRSRSPKFQASQNHNRKKWLYAALCFIISLVSFVVQTETAVYIQHTLHWNKAYCMLWLTHGSWSLLWPTQLLILRLQNRKQSWRSFWLRHKAALTNTAHMVESHDLHPAKITASRNSWKYMIRTTAGVTTFLTIAGGSWYVAIDLTTPSDLTAIYNCSAFFAYVFSILLLKEKARLNKIVSVGLAILGVLVVAYGDSGHPKHGSHSGGSTNPKPDEEPDNRALGNLIIGIGSVMYGLYEVLYKKYACPPDGADPIKSMQFANTFGSMIGCFTLCVLWIPLPILHFTGLEIFELPSGKAAALLAISTLSNATFSGAFLVLMSLTSPVLSSVAALVTIFLVAITDYFLTGEALSAATLIGGSIIVVAFVLLCWATYQEMNEEEHKRETEEGKNFDENEAMLADSGLLEGGFDNDDLGRGKRRGSD